MRSLQTILLALTLICVASAANVSGKWTAVFTDPSVDFKSFSEMVFDLSATGDRLTGTVRYWSPAHATR